MNSVDHIVNAIKSDLLETLITPPDDQFSISANLCEAILQMQPQGEHSNLYVACTWSRTAQVPKEIPSKVKIPKEYFRTIEEIGRQLRPKLESKLNSFVGKISELKGEPDDEGKMQGEILLAFLSEDNEVLKGKLSLNSNDYALACDAHKQSRAVKLQGILHRGIRVHIISDYKDFEIVN